MNWAGMGPDNPSSAAAIASALGYTPANRALTPEILKASGVVSTSLLGTTTEQALGFVQVPAGKMTANSAIEIENTWNSVGANGNVILMIRVIAGLVGAGLTGTVMLNNSLGTGFNIPWRGLFFFKNSLSAQGMYSNGPSPMAGSIGSMTSSTIDGSAAFTLRFNAITANALDQISLLYNKATHYSGFAGV